MTIPADTAPPAANGAHRRVILFADDESFIRELGAMVLRQHGFEVLLAEDGAQAVDLYRREGQRIDVVILDLSMPNITGEESLRQIAAINPDVRVLLSSGSVDENPSVCERPQVRGFIAKPYRLTDLIDHIRAALDNDAGSS
jgi:CheY-like chemotaxis protein